MRFSHLYDLAVALSPRAARIAAMLLVHENDMPDDLRRSLSIALAASAKGNAATELKWTPDNDPDAAAAARFVAACTAANRAARSGP